MRDLERRALLFRQMAALRRRGLSQSEALDLASQALPQGPLRDAVAAAKSQLQAGQVSAPAVLPALLAADTPPEAFDRAADAADAELAARAATALTRAYACIALLFALSLLLLRIPLGAGWAGELAGTATSPAGVLLLAAVAFVGTVVSAAGIALAGAVAPGARELRSAASLLEAASLGRGLGETLPGGLFYVLFEARRGSVGEAGAAAEVARELVREGQEKMLWFRHFAPVAGAVGWAVIVAGLTLVAAVIARSTYSGLMLF